jgi:DNA helicase II / ATP-dependent DNA helicase PcrA
VHDPSEPPPALDDEQRRAVESTGRRVLVVAGPGSGKTRVLTERAVRAAERSPGAALCLCFTRRAVDEVRARVQGRLADLRALRVDTIHRFCLRILRREAEHAEGLRPGFTLLGGAAQRRVAREAASEAGLDAKEDPSVLVLRGLEALRLARPADGPWAPGGRYAGVLAHYERALLRSNSTDFAGLVLGVRDLFARRPDVLARWRERISELLVDEAQDVTEPEWNVIEALVCGEDGASLFAVGDPDQAIFDWRPGSRSLVRLVDSAPGLETVALELNFRSSANVLEAADALVGYNADRIPKSLVATRASGEQLLSIAAEDPEDEARTIARLVRNAIADGVAADQVAVLYRTHGEARPIEAALARAGIAYAVRGGVPFHERADVADVLAYLRLLDNPADEDAFWRASAAPRAGVGPVTRRRLKDIVDEANVDVPWSKRTTLCDAIASERVRGQFRGQTREGLGALAARLAELRELRPGSAAAAVEAVLEYLGRTAWLDELEARADGGQREDALDVLRGLARDHDERDGDAGLAGFLADVALGTAPTEAAEAAPSAEGDTKAPRAAVQLSTLHGAKGSEFDLVVIAGLVDGVLPHVRSVTERSVAGVESERRLLFVGLTRARNQVILTWPRRRRITAAGYGPAAPSPFFDEFPADIVARLRSEHVDDLAVERGPATAGLHLGDRVEHPHWGPGYVVLFTSRDADARAIVDFDGFGPRELFLRHTTLRVLRGT